MEVIEIARSPNDAVFRARVRQLLDGARTHMGIIAGEFSAYRYPDLREGVRQAIQRGVKVEGYGNQPARDLLDQMTSDGMEVTVAGLRSLHHYFVADDRNAIVSFKPLGAGPTVPGTRWGKMYLGDPEMAAAVTSYQQFLRGWAKGASQPTLLNELTVAITNHPLLARRIRIADNVLAVAGVERPTPSGLVEAMLASFSPNAANPEHGDVSDEMELALVNQIALITATMALAQFASVRDAPVVSQIEPSRESVAEATLSMKIHSKESSPRHSIWETPS